MDRKCSVGWAGRRATTRGVQDMQVRFHRSPLAHCYARRQRCSARVQATTSCAVLREWVEQLGGSVHPAVSVVDPAPSGSRGLVVIEPMTLDDVEDFPLLLVPEDCVMSSEVAR